MKKIVCLLFSFLLLVSLVPTFTFANESADYIFETYKYVAADHAQEIKSGKNPIADGLWQFEYLEKADNQFKLMIYSASGYYKADNTATDWEYPRARENGGDLHPGPNAQAARTFVAPADGTVNLDVVFVKKYDINTTTYAVYLNDKIIYPTASDVGNSDGVTETDVANGYTASTAIAKTYTVALKDIEIKKGDCIRCVVGIRDSSHASSAAYVNDEVITYTKSDKKIIPTSAPTDIEATEITHNSAKITWKAVEGFKGYNIYTGAANNPQKVNEELITSTEYVLTDLKSYKTTNVYITCVHDIGYETELSDICSFRTEKAPETDAVTVVEETTADADVSPTDGSKNTESNTTPIIIGACAAVVVIAIVIVIIVVSKKKKK